MSCFNNFSFQTHPSQTAFLSSVDLHTQAGYQHFLQEAVAVVCSVKYDETKIFRLTDQGMDIVGTCSEPGFHTHARPHDGSSLFEECHPDDVIYKNENNIEVVDLRN